MPTNGALSASGVYEQRLHNVSVTAFSPADTCSCCDAHQYGRDKRLLKHLDCLHPTPLVLVHAVDLHCQSARGLGILCQFAHHLICVARDDHQKLLNIVDVYYHDAPHSVLMTVGNTESVNGWVSKLRGRGITNAASLYETMGFGPDSDRFVLPSPFGTRPAKFLRNRIFNCAGGWGCPGTGAINQFPLIGARETRGQTRINKHFTELQTNAVFSGAPRHADSKNTSFTFSVTRTTRPSCGL